MPFGIHASCFNNNVTAVRNSKLKSCDGLFSEKNLTTTSASNATCTIDQGNIQYISSILNNSNDNEVTQNSSEEPANTDDPFKKYANTTDKNNSNYSINIKTIKNCNNTTTDKDKTALLGLIHSKDDFKYLISEVNIATESAVKYKENSNSDSTKQFKRFLSNSVSICHQILTMQPQPICKELLDSVLEVLLAFTIADLTIDAHIGDATNKLKAENKLYIIEYTLKKISKGLATRVQLNTEYETQKNFGSNENSPFMIFLFICGAIGTDAFFLQSNLKITSLTLLTGAVIAATADKSTHINKFANIGLKHLDRYNFKNDSNIKITQASKLQLLHKSVKTEIKNINTIDNYITNIFDIKAIIHDMSAEDKKYLQYMTVKVKIAGEKLRLPILQALKIILSKAEEGIKKLTLLELTRLEARCYGKEPKTFIACSEAVDEVMQETEWSSQIECNNAIGKLTYIISGVPDEKQREYLATITFNRLLNKDELKKRRSTFNFQAFLAISIGVLLSNLGALAKVIQNIKEAVVILLQALGTGFFNSTFFLAQSKSNWFLNSTHANTAEHLIKEIKLTKDINETAESTNIDTNTPQISDSDEKSSENANLLKSCAQETNNQNLDAVIESIIKNDKLVIHIDITENINNYIGQLCAKTIAESKTKEKQIIGKQILEYSISYKGQNVPLIYALYDQLSKMNNTDGCKALLILYYYIISTHEGEFYTTLSCKKDNVYMAMLDGCKCLAIISHTEDATNKAELAKAFQNAMNNAMKDVTSVWHILNTNNAWKNFTIRFVTGAVAFILSTVAAITLSAFITPIGAFGVVVVLFTAKGLIDKKFSYSYSKKNLKSFNGFVKSIATISTHTTNSQESDTLSRESSSNNISISRDLASTNTTISKTTENIEQNQAYQASDVSLTKSNYFTQRLSELCTVQDKDNLEESQNSYNTRIVNFITANAYDRKSMVDIIKSIGDIYKNISNVNTNQKKYLRVFLLNLQTAIINDQIKQELMNYHHDSAAYNIVFSVIFSLVWAAYISPLVPILMAKYLAGSVFGVCEATISLRGAKHHFYNILSKIPAISRYTTPETKQESLDILDECLKSDLVS